MPPPVAAGSSRSLPTVRRSGSNFRDVRRTSRSNPMSPSQTFDSARRVTVGSRARQAIAPAYLLACLILGGSAQGVWQNMILQLAGVAIIAWAAVAPAEEPLLSPAKQLLFLGILSILVVALQLIPLPPGVWSHLGPRARFVDGYRALGLAAPALPLSVTPAATLDSLLGIIPPLAIRS